MKRHHRGRQRRAFPSPATDRLASAAADNVQVEIRESNRAGLRFLGAAACCVTLAACFYVAGYRLGIDLALVSGWFCGAFAVAWFITAAAHRLPFFARWTLHTLHLPARFRPSSVLAALLWFLIFHGGGLWIIRALKL